MEVINIKRKEKYEVRKIEYANRGIRVIFKGLDSIQNIAFGNYPVLKFKFGYEDDDGKEVYYNDTNKYHDLLILKLDR